MTPPAHPFRVFEPARLGGVPLANRLLRAATFEGLCDAEGTPTQPYLDRYAALAELGLGALITGFAFVSRDGRAMQPGQAGLETDAKLPAFRRVTETVHERGGRIFVQLAHAGRQTTPAAAGGRTFGPSRSMSFYFNHPSCELSVDQIERVIDAFAQAARRAREAGFDGVQLHAAHGYLIHQFLHPGMNDRSDAYGVRAGAGVGTAFLAALLARVRSVCGPDYPLLIKISAGDRAWGGFEEWRFIELIRFLDDEDLAAIEISYGTMDDAFNIFRGATLPLRTILAVNPRFQTPSRLQRLVFRVLVAPLLRRRLIPFSPAYNLGYACLARKQTRTPLICVGGFRSGAQLRRAIEEQGIDFVGLCRPLLCEPGFVANLRQRAETVSRCRNCNRCAVMCDSGQPTRCYRDRDPAGELVL